MTISDNTHEQGLCLSRFVNFKTLGTRIEHQKAVGPVPNIDLFKSTHTVDLLQ
jgi:hypothetical protein